VIVFTNAMDQRRRRVYSTVKSVVLFACDLFRKSLATQALTVCSSILGFPYSLVSICVDSVWFIVTHVAGVGE